MPYKDPEKARECRRAWNLKHQKKRRVANRIWSEQNREYYRNWKRLRRRAALVLLGGKCRHCGFSDERALCIDHINGDGHVERKRFGSRNRYAENFIFHHPEVAYKTYQLLCANCNSIKRIECGEL